MFSHCKQSDCLHTFPCRIRPGKALSKAGLDLLLVTASVLFPALGECFAHCWQDVKRTKQWACKKKKIYQWFDIKGKKKTWHISPVLLHLLEGREDKRVYKLARPIIHRIPNRCGWDIVKEGMCFPSFQRFFGEVLEIGGGGDSDAHSHQVFL